MLKGVVSSAPTLRRMAAARTSPAVYAVTVDMIDNPNRNGFAQSARVNVSVSVRREVPVVPLAAVFMFGDKHYVLDVSKKLAPVEVSVGASDDNFAELRSGPSVGTLIAVGSSEVLRRLVFGPAAMN